MKKIIFVMPLMAISLLASCAKGGGGGNDPNQTTVTFSEESVGCTLYYNNISYAKGATFKIPAGVNVNLTIKANQNYLPVFEDGLTISEATTYNFNPVKEEITVKVANSGKCVIKAISETPKANLDAYSWSEINQLSEMGLAKTYFEVGNTKKVKLKDQSLDYTVRIIGFNHDDLADGSGKAGITFEFENVFTADADPYKYVTVWDETDNFDYRESTLNNFLNDETDAESVISMLPNDLKKEGIIKPVNKLVGVSTDGGQKYIATPFEEGKYPKLFPLAYAEMCDYTTKDITPGEAGDPATGGGIYEYYQGHSKDTEADRNYRIKLTTSGDEYYYWLRSPRTASVGSALFVYEGGEIAAYTVSVDAASIAPAFCI